MGQTRGRGTAVVVVALAGALMAGCSVGATADSQQEGMTQAMTVRQSAALTAVGTDGAIPATAWVEVAALGSSEPATLPNAIWAAADDDLYLSRAGAVVHFDGAAVTDVSPMPGLAINAIAGADGDDVWAVGQGHIFRRCHHGAWTEVPFEQTGSSAGEGALRSIWVTRPNDVWFAGALDGVFRWDGTSVSRVDVPAAGTSRRSYTGVWASRGDRALWLVGDWSARLAPSLIVGRIGDVWTHYGRQGVIWTADDLVSSHGVMAAVWGSAPDDVYAVTADYAGRLFRFNGATWSQATLPQTDARVDLYDLWGTRRRDVWAVGRGGDALLLTTHAAAFHFDGSAWTVDATPPETFGFLRVTGTRDSVWAADENQRVYRRPRR